MEVMKMMMEKAINMDRESDVPSSEIYVFMD